MIKLAEEIKRLGMRPGLMDATSCGAHDDGKNVLFPSIPGRDNPRYPVLDPTIAENMERIRYNISSYDAWGYEMVKHDFSTYDLLGQVGFQMTENITTNGWHFNDRSKDQCTNHSRPLPAIRNEGRNMYLIGCNTVSHLSAGIFELNRIGDDTSGKEWSERENGR